MVKDEFSPIVISVSSIKVILHFTPGAVSILSPSCISVPGSAGKLSSSLITVTLPSPSISTVPIALSESPGDGPVAGESAGALGVFPAGAGVLGAGADVLVGAAGAGVGAGAAGALVTGAGVASATLRLRLTVWVLPRYHGHIRKG